MTQTGINENYGKVLYELGISGTDVDQMDASLRSTPKLGWALDNPVISRRAKHRIIERVFPRSLHSFLKTVSDHRRIGDIPGILEAYRQCVRREKGILPAYLYCVSRPDDTQYQQMKEFVKKKYGARDVELTVEKRPELIGGFVLQVGDREYDWSLRGRIRQLEQSLVRR